MKKLLFVVCLFATAAVNAQGIRYERIDSAMQAAAATQFSGVVLIAESGTVKYLQAFGYRDFAKQIPLQVDDVFELASVSKQFTAMVIMMLKERGKLNYDDLLEKYVNIPYKGITIRQLLTHTSGLPDYQAVMDAHWDKSRVAGNADIIAYLNQYAPPKLSEPGVKYQYSNTGYVMLASVAEKASGRDFTEFCRTEIFRKLGMQHTDIRSPQEKAAVPNFALGHLPVKNPDRFVRADSFPSSDYTIWLGNRKGPGRISSIATDLLKWDQALYTEKLVKQATLQDAFTPMKLNDGKLSYYGFGWIIIPGNGNDKIVWHNGDNPGYKTEIKRFLGNGNTLIMLCNNASDHFEKLVKFFEIELK
ncbi:MAG: beta-lactamase family protein [Chitinophagaceae bacterium]|nr:beta-lactamase family protein [Chitinophagaceae bacterium]